MITKQHTHVLARIHMIFAFFSIALGGTFGLLQGLVRAGAITLPNWMSYYQILTLHGVLLALVATTYFIFAFLLAGHGVTLGDLSKTEYMLAQWGTILLTTGVVLAAITILRGDASVLYTFYLPLQASPWFYIGLTLFVIGTWLFAAGLIHQYFAWRKIHPGQKTPLFAFLSTVTLILWIIASLGVAMTVLFQMIPLSFGWIKGVHVELSRLLFWYFGHPLVYFWLLPAYIAWYTVMPRLIGGKLFSDTLARFAFLLFLVFSFPVGVHHQLTEPGIEDGWKFFQVILTFMVVIPSLMTAFNVFASLESVPRSGSQKSSLFGWISALPWGDVRFSAMIIAMLFFIPGGIGGLVNASYQMNAMVHNTLFVVGHFHITVGTPVILTFFAISYWLIPHLTGRTFTPLANRLGIIQTIIWSLGMLLMSWSQHALGLMGAPRRTAYTTYQDHPQAQLWFNTPWANYTLMAIGGVLLFVGIILMLVIVIYLGFFAPRSERSIFPLAEARDDIPQPAFLESWKLWLTITVVLILIAYTVPIFDILAHHAPIVRGMRTW